MHDGRVGMGARLWMTAAGVREVVRGYGHGTTVDPDRWSDFPESRPPQTRASRPDPVKAKGPAGDGARHTSRHRVTVGELVSRAVDAGTSLPAGALASLVCQIAHAALGAEPERMRDTQSSTS